MENMKRWSSGYMHPYRKWIRVRRCLVLLSEEVVSLEARAEEDLGPYFPFRRMFSFLSKWGLGAFPRLCLRQRHPLARSATRRDRGRVSPRAMGKMESGGAAWRCAAYVLQPYPFLPLADKPPKGSRRVFLLIYGADGQSEKEPPLRSLLKKSAETL